MNKTDARRVMSRDFIPQSAGTIDVAGLTFRRTLEHEVYRCSTRTGADPQSGPYYCGDLADWIHVSDDGTRAVTTCNRHRPRTAVFV